MKTILCYGDSNTWGLNSETEKRFPPAERWTTLLQEQLGGEYRVVEEGLNGRTTGMDDPGDGCPQAKNGQSYLVPCLRSHAPVDLVILMLGTNDLKVNFFTSVDQIAENIGTLIQTARTELGTFQGYEPKILLAAPMPVGDTIETSRFREAFGGRRAIAPSVELATALRRTAGKNSCAFLDAGKIAQPNPIDAIHFSREGHRSFAMAAAQKVREIFA